MKSIIVVSLVVLTVFLGSLAQAQVSLVLYDDLNAKFIDPTRWFGSVQEGDGIVNYEIGRKISSEPLFGYKGLNLLNVRYGATGSDTGSTSSFNRLVFYDGSSISTIQARIQVKAIQATECEANPGISWVGARIGGYFFNTGTATPGSAVNDVGAYIEVRRRADSTDPAKVLQVVAYVLQCTTSDCTTATQLGTTQDLGTTKVNKRVKVRVTWANNQFIFKKDKDPEVALPHGVSVGGAPGTVAGGLKRLDTRHVLANCSSGRVFGYSDVFLDDVQVNQ